MLEAYIIREESGVSTTYQYNTLYSWVFLVIAALMIASIILNITELQLLSAALIVFYFGIKLILGRKVTAKIKQALNSGSVEISGGKYFFSNPIRIKIPKSS